MNIDHFGSINTKEKIDQIVNSLSPPTEYIDLNKLEDKISLKIRIVKMQYYFKEEFKKLKNTYSSKMACKERKA